MGIFGHQFSQNGNDGERRFELMDDFGAMRAVGGIGVKFHVKIKLATGGKNGVIDFGEIWGGSFGGGGG